MLLLNKFIKITDYIKIYNCNVTSASHSIIIYKNNTVWRDIYYNNDWYRYTQKNNIAIKREAKFFSIHVRGKRVKHGNNNYKLKIYINSLKSGPYIGIEYTNVYSYVHQKGATLIINFSKKDGVHKILHKLAIDTYMYLREYFSVKN